MQLPEFNSDADFNAEPCENCAICGDQPNCLMLWTGSVQLTSLCRTHALALADFIKQIAGPS